LGEQNGLGWFPPILKDTFHEFYMDLGLEMQMSVSPLFFLTNNYKVSGNGTRRCRGINKVAGF
jgi:hypothetical protein